jgi:hypothetical protein
VGKAIARALREEGCTVAAFVEVDPRKLGQTIGGARVVSPGEAALLPRAFHLGAVGQKGARERIRAEARRLGLHEPDDFVAVA